MHSYLQALVKSIKDSGSIVRDIFHQLDDIEYGAYNTKTGSFVYEIDGTNYRDIKLLNPEETLKHKRGTCYEQSILTAYLATQRHLKYNCSYYLNICGNTHMTCSVNYQGKWYWLEHAWYNRRKLYGPFDNLNDINSLVCSYWYEEDHAPIILHIPNFNVSKFFKGKHMNTEITDCYSEKCIDIMGYYNDNQIDTVKMDKNHIATAVILKDGTSIKM